MVQLKSPYFKRRRVKWRHILLILVGVGIVGTVWAGRTPALPEQLKPVQVVQMPQGNPTALCTSVAGLPDTHCTPGSTSPNVTQANIQMTICVKGYTATIRPSTSVTDPIKTERMKAYGDTDSRSNYELDHLIPLELGGASDVNNLWPEPYNITNGARVKDQTENRLKAEVCAGSKTLLEAQTEISTNWMMAQ